jgi:hypothetical protein
MLANYALAMERYAKKRKENLENYKKMKLGQPISKSTDTSTFIQNQYGQKDIKLSTNRNLSDEDKAKLEASYDEERRRRVKAL